MLDIDSTTSTFSVIDEEWLPYELGTKYQWKMDGSTTARYDSDPDDNYSSSWKRSEDGREGGDLYGHEQSHEIFELTARVRALENNINYLLLAAKIKYQPLIHDDITMEQRKLSVKLNDFLSRLPRSPKTTGSFSMEEGTTLFKQSAFISSVGCTLSHFDSIVWDLQASPFDIKVTPPVEELLFTPRLKASMSFNNFHYMGKFFGVDSSDLNKKLVTMKHNNGAPVAVQVVGTLFENNNCRTVPFLISIGNPLLPSNSDVRFLIRRSMHWSDTEQWFTTPLEIGAKSDIATIAAFLATEVRPAAVNRTFGLSWKADIRGQDSFANIHSRRM